MDIPVLYNKQRMRLTKVTWSNKMKRFPLCVRALSRVSALLRSVRTGSATAAFCRASGVGKTAFTRRDGHRVGDGDALPGGREREGCRDARREEGARPTDNIQCRGFNNSHVMIMICRVVTDRNTVMSERMALLCVFTDIARPLFIYSIIKCNSQCILTMKG